MATIAGFDYKPGRDVYEHLGIAEDRSRWGICKYCGFLFQNPRPEPEDILSLYENGIYRRGKTYDAYFFETRYQRPLMHLEWASQCMVVSSETRVLDIGAGYGGAVKAFRDRGLNAVGVELDGKLCHTARERFGVDLINAGILECNFDPATFDLLYSAHVHEHLDDFGLVNERLLTWLKPGGFLCCVVPTYRMSGTNGRGFINVFHNSIFTKTSLRNMMAIAGLSPMAFRYPLSHSLAEVWGLARKPWDDRTNNPQISRDNYRFVINEIRCAPVIMDGVYAAIRFARLGAWPFRALRRLREKHRA